MQWMISRVFDPAEIRCVEFALLLSPLALQFVWEPLRSMNLLCTGGYLFLAQLI